MEKPILVVMVGLPGSGKTTVANELVKNYGFKIFSSDDYRLKLLGDENNQDNNYYIFKRLKKDVRYNLKNGNNCIFDATNVTMGCRKRIFKGLNDIEFNAIAIVISTNIEECFKRNSLRERFVPEDDIRTFLPYWLLLMCQNLLINLRCLLKKRDLIWF